MQFVSDFADQAVMLPMAAILLLMFAIMGWWRGAASWLAAIGVTFGSILLLKAGLVLLAANYGNDYGISPSGHVAAGCVVYGGVAVLLLRGFMPASIVAAIPVIIVGVIGYTRLALAVHTGVEVVIGAAVGLAGVALLAATAGARPRVLALPVTAAGACTVLTLHGAHMPAEAAIRFASLNWL